MEEQSLQNCAILRAYRRQTVVAPSGRDLLSYRHIPRPRIFKIIRTLDSYPTDQYDSMENSNLCRGKDGETVAVVDTLRTKKNLDFSRVDTLLDEVQCEGVVHRVKPKLS